MRSRVPGKSDTGVAPRTFFAALVFLADRVTRGTPELVSVPGFIPIVLALPIKYRLALEPYGCVVRVISDPGVCPVLGRAVMPKSPPRQFPLTSYCAVPAAPKTRS